MSKNRKNTVIRNTFEANLDVNGARNAANQIIAQLSQMLNISAQPDDLGDDVISSPMNGWLTINDVEDINEDPDSRFAFQYSMGEFTAIVLPSDNSVELIIHDDVIDPSGNFILDAECPQDGAFKISKWKKFDPSTINEEE